MKTIKKYWTLGLYVRGARVSGAPPPPPFRAVTARRQEPYKFMHTGDS